MLRQMMLFVVCLSVLAVGCEKKQPDTTPSPKAPKASKAPAGMVPLNESATIFISAKPVTVAEYLDYLNGTGQPVPPRYQQVQPSSAGAAAPVTGLTRKDAELCAVWHLKRLPTTEDWQQAKVVGQRPYPWRADGTPESEAAETFLIQDWLPGSGGQIAASAAKAAIGQRILGEAKAEALATRQRLEQALAAKKAEQAGISDEVKTAFFSMLDKEKQAAELDARLKGQEEMVNRVNRLAFEKGKLAIKQKVNEIDEKPTGEGTKDYESWLNDMQAQMEKERNELQSATASMQDEIVGLTKKLEEKGTAEAAEAIQKAEAALGEASREIKDAAQAAALTQKLQAALEQLEKAPTLAAKLPALEELKERMARLDDQIGQLSAKAPDTARLEELKEKIQRFGEALNRRFPQEEKLMKHFEDAVDLVARNRAVASGLEALRKVFSTQDQKAQ